MGEYIPHSFTNWLWLEEVSGGIGLIWMININYKMRLWHIINGFLIPKLITDNEMSVRKNNWQHYKL